MTMKILLFLLQIFGWLFTTAPISPCLKFHTGTFEISGDGVGTTTVTRTGDKQIEENKGLGYKASFDIVWKDDCTYELHKKKVLQGHSKFQWQPNYFLKVE